VMRWGLRNAKLTASRWASAAGVQSGEVEGGRKEAWMICWRRVDTVDGERDEKRAMCALEEEMGKEGNSRVSMMIGSGKQCIFIFV
jgi:hypothetical protein